MALENMIGIATTIVVIFGPLLFGLTGWIRTRHTSVDANSKLIARWDWKLVAMSTLAYTLAFNLTFFIQELFLVLPKAFAPGLRPKLFHNNHTWEGDNPLASLFQGTGALAIFFTGMICALCLPRASKYSITVRLFLFWMAYSGIFMALPQVVIGALSAQSDVGMAMSYLELGATTKAAIALLALAVIPLLAIWLGTRLLRVVGNGNALAGAKTRTFFIFNIATLPALIAIALIVLFRIPREWIEVVMVPVVVTVVGIVWLQASAWSITGAKPLGALANASITWPLAAVIFLLLFFQLVLRPGIRFF